MRIAANRELSHVWLSGKARQAKNGVWSNLIHRTGTPFYMSFVHN